MQEQHQCDGLLYSKYDEIGIPKLSIEQLKKLINEENISDKLAEEIINSLYHLSVIAYELNNNSNN